MTSHRDQSKGGRLKGKKLARKQAQTKLERQETQAKKTCAEPEGQKAALQKGDRRLKGSAIDV